MCKLGLDEVGRTEGQLFRVERRRRGAGARPRTLLRPHVHTKVLRAQASAHSRAVVPLHGFGLGFLGTAVLW